MNYIFHVFSERSAHNFWRVSDNIFRIIEYRNFTSIMRGSDYILIEERLIPAFDTLLSDEIEIKKVILKRFSTNEQWNNYYELIIKNHVSPENMQTVIEEGGTIWQYEHSLFVSNAFKKELEKLMISELIFSPGFSFFGGI